MIKKIMIEKMYEGMEAEDITIYWRKKEGSPVSEGEIILDAETFKSTFEIPSSAAGFLRKQCVQSGEEVNINMTIGLIADSLEEELSESECV
jgi:pyruvate/2-oxoglutarate dehydrogenase complex dihydrolipoamide acyltransferase (E2) component